MEGINLKNFLKKRKGVSQIIGAIFMLAVVAAIGSIILIQGMTGINTFTSFLETVQANQVIRSTHESFIVEHVRFDPGSENQVYIWIRNTGLDDITIETVAMIKIDTQELVILNQTSNQQIFPDDMKVLVNKNTSNPSVTDVTMPLSCAEWDSSPCFGADYKISITTTQGTTVDVAARPFNT